MNSDREVSLNEFSIPVVFIVSIELLTSVGIPARHCQS